MIKQKVILLGANGQLGLLIKNIAPENFELFAFGSAELDITDPEALERTINQIKPDFIINSAAYTLVDKAEEEIDKARAVNALGPANLAKAAGEKTKIIHISTDFVFDGSKTEPYLTTDETHPLGVYGQSKLEGEQALLSLHPNSAIIRTAWLYSAEGKNFMNTMLHLMKTRDELSVVADQKGTPTSAHTLAEVVWKFIEKAVPPGIYHWTDKDTDNQEASWYDFACAIQQEAFNLGILNKQITLKAIATEDYPTPATRPAYSILDKSLTYQVLGFEGRLWQEELKSVLSKLATN